MNDDLVRAAIIHHGALTRAQALTLGFNDGELRRAVRTGGLTRLRQGVYAAAALYHSMTEAERHLVLARAVAGAQRGHVALSGASAAAWHRLRLYGCDLTRVYLVRLGGGTRRHDARCVHRTTTSLVDDDVIETDDGLHVTSLARTIWDLATDASLESIVVAADSALANRTALRGELDDLAERFASHPHSRRARTAIRLADGRSGSAGESVTRVQFYRYGIPMPELQFEVRDQAGHLIGVTDFVWEEHCHLGEFDGKVKYQKFLRPGEGPADAVFREKRREDRMRARGHGMSRFVWASIMPQRVAASMAELRSSLEISRRTFAA